jgi:ATP-dependent helicase/nuclease subunit A
MTVSLHPKEPAASLSCAAVFLSAGTGETLHERGNCFADWLISALLVHPCGGVLRTLADCRELPFVDTDSEISIALPPEQEEQTLEAKPVEATEAEADAALVEQLRAGYAWKYPAAVLCDVPAKVSVTGIVHREEQTTLERPAFLSAEGLTAAEMGTALHAFLEHADFARLAAARKQGGTALEEAIHAESERQVQAQLTAPHIAERLDERRIRTFAESEAFARIECAKQVLREYAFITALPAETVLAAQGTHADGEAADAQVLVQGIADLVLVYDDHIELLDYKTDRGKTEEEFLQAYRAQLELYALAIEKRFAPLRITYKGIYSFALGRLIEA